LDGQLRQYEQDLVKIINLLPAKRLDAVREASFRESLKAELVKQAKNCQP